MLSSDIGIQTFGIRAPERNRTTKIRKTMHGKSLIIDIDEGHEALYTRGTVEVLHRR